uniref:Uncharacterized protein n=1 Tax=Anguilla anguilla TaxID=7936 RepID=A0A0E9P5P3_ANGAN
MPNEKFLVRWSYFLIFVRLWGLCDSLSL